MSTAQKSCRPRRPRYWSGRRCGLGDQTRSFDSSCLPEGPGDGTDLRWTLLVEEPRPNDSLVGHMRKRLNQLINANLRYTFGQ